MARKKKSKNKGKKLTSSQLQQAILKLFKRHPKKRLNPKQVSKKLKVANNRDSIQHALEQLAEDSKLLPLGDYKYQLKKDYPRSSSQNFHEGFVDMTRTGSAYIMCEDLEDDVHVSPKNMNSALHGDRVRIRVWTPRGRRRQEGEVVRVLDRVTEHFLGTLWSYPKYAMVSPDGKMPLDIKVSLENINEANDGDKVIVKITKWPNGKQKHPMGVVTSVLGKPGSSDIEMKSILINNGFQLEFPAEVLKESENLPEEITKEEISDRRDMREFTTFTIDPETAKDFDDALSIRYLSDGNCEVGIHIADVSHFVKPDSYLDKEAFDRSTSVYLVDRVLPMLPEKLSNELCSLRPHEDKLTFSAVFIFEKGTNRIVNRWYGRSIIHSDRRFTYEEAQEVIDKGDGDFASELKHLNDIAKHLRKRRFKKGAINFETEEVKFRLDEEGVPVEVYVKERKEAHMLIEDFMLLANREVATYIANQDRDNPIPYIYRIHDEPDPDKVVEFARFAKEMGFELNISSPQEIARSYNRLIKAARKQSGLKLLEPIAIRTMAKAEYSPNNIGHYGLGFEFYTHFTSPIRRYSDVIAHRLLDKNLGKKQYRTNQEKLEEQCGHISRQERRAMDAERESVKYKQVEFMENHVGEIFKGLISGIGESGIFIELKANRCEGMIRYETMEGYYEVGDSRLRVKNQQSGKEYKMGDEVFVRIVRTDLAKRQIDMMMVDEVPDMDRVE